MIDESSFKVWREHEVTKLFYKIIENSKEEMENKLLTSLTFKQEEILSYYFWKGMVHAYNTCLVFNSNHLKEMEEENKDEN